ncbi:MAG: LysR family transcriptional regulator [Burkholderiaceae bacterium]
MNPLRLDLQSLRLFLAVARTGSITQAAHQSHLALGAASARLKDLEERLSIRLLERHARGARLTEAGRLVALRAHAIEHEMAQMGVEIEDLSKGVSGHVRLIANMSSIAAVLPNDLARFLKAHSGVRIDMAEYTSREVEQLLLEGRADLGILTTPRSSSELTLFPYYKDEVVAAVPTQAVWLKRKTVAIKELLGQDLILLQEGGAISDWLADLARQEKLRLRVRVRAKGFDALAQLVAAGLGITVLPKVVALRLAKLSPIQMLPIRGATTQRTVSIACPPGGPSLPAARELLEFLQQAHISK